MMLQHTSSETEARAETATQAEVASGLPLERLERASRADRAWRIAQREKLEKQFGWGPFVFAVSAAAIGLAAMLAVVVMSRGGATSFWGRLLVEWGLVVFLLPWGVILIAGWIAGTWMLRCRREQRIYAREPDSSPSDNAP